MNQQMYHHQKSVHCGLFL